MKKTGRKSSNVEIVTKNNEYSSKPITTVSLLDKDEMDREVLNRVRKKPLRVSLGDVILGKNPNTEREKKWKERVDKNNNDLLKFSKKVAKGIKDNKPLPYDPHRETDRD